MPVVSIIIPVFNVEKYLHRCLDSVCSQTFNDFECLLVDDASKDNSLGICDEYALIDKRFKVIHKTINEGPQKARKTGSDNAIAEYIIFVDSDDWLEKKALELLMNKRDQNDADVVRANFRYHYLNYSIYYLMDFPSSKKEDPLIFFFMNYNVALHATLYKKCLFEDYFVSELDIGEDVITNVQIYSKIKTEKICYINDIIYNYDNRTNGITKKIHNEYLSFEESPTFKYIFFIERYLNESGKNSIELISAFKYYFISKIIIPYLLNYKNISQKEINIFYNEYWKNYDRKYLFFGCDRRIITIFHISIVMGKLYVYFLPIINIIENLYNRIKSEGIILAINYYNQKYLK